ncbi:MAG: glycoside hydrolase family 3 protein [Schwartzia sp.]|nr:glycoside hydrolase family 3 protein [Schwartzia sp. (in: firmicutes)]
MRYWQRLGAALLTAAMLFCGCARGGAPAEPPPPPKDRVAAAVREMTTAEKAGQLMMVGVYGEEMNEDIAFLLNEYHIGGVILFDRNIGSAGQVRDLTSAMQKTAGDWPLLVAIDEEGGLVARGRDVIPAPPSAADIGAGKDPALARDWAARTAKELKSLGVNLNFAPVADLGLAGDRSYSDEPETVAAFAGAAADGYAAAGLLCTLKHFPGIGKGEADTHLGRVTVDIDLDELRAEDMRPFREVLRGRRSEEVFVMVGHVDYPAVDGDNPASLSPKVYELLRQETGFDGVVVTDDLCMGAVTDQFSAAEAAVQAVRAGADLTLICHEYEDMNAAHRALCRAIEDGTIPAARVDEALTRVLRAKAAHVGVSPAG